MIQIRKAADRGEGNLGWLDSKHTFSFANYHDPQHMGFGNLRVINDDRVQPGHGFGTHSHRDMEIISYVVDGALEHKDSMGFTSVLHRGDVQRMTAGTGVTHSEFNPSDSALLRFLQIWILPERNGLEPGYEETTFSAEDKKHRLRLVVSRDGRAGSMTIHQSVDLYASTLSNGAEVTHDLAAGHDGWVQVVNGAVSLNGENLIAGDGAAILETPKLSFRAADKAEFLLFDLS